MISIGRLNIFKRFIGSILIHQRPINNSPAFSDEILRHLFLSNPSSLTTVKMIRDQYERLFLQQARICELTKELCDGKDKESLENKRKLMFYRKTSTQLRVGIRWTPEIYTLHSRGLFEEFRGYLQGVIQPNSTTPMSTKKLYKSMIDMTFKNYFKTNSIIASIVDDMFKCLKIDLNNLSDDDKIIKTNELAQELENIYGLLSQSVHQMKKSQHDKEFIICSNNLNKQQICMIKSIAVNFLRLNPQDIYIEKI